jgi:hypothetical protein
MRLTRTPGNSRGCIRRKWAHKLQSSIVGLLLVADTSNLWYPFRLWHGRIWHMNALDHAHHSFNAFTYATVTRSQISNRVHTVSKPYRPDFTRMDLHRNPCQFLRIPWLPYGEKPFWVVFKNFYNDFNSVLISVLNRFEPLRPAA